MKPKWTPSPLSCNHDAYKALVVGLLNPAVNVMSGQIMGFDWGPMIERLKVRGIWSADLERKLTVMECEMRSIIGKGKPADGKKS